MTEDAIEIERAPPGAMSGDLSHQLRTPLTVIRMQAQLMMRLTRRDGLRGEDRRERLLHGLQRIDEAVSVLNEVLDRMELEDGGAAPTIQHVD
ncbi:MAG: hypothetical protein IT336_14235 [Thermomicrobiales bacterium]|nr:hypothetical protein [Thermomicrobiales bacterium]